MFRKKIENICVLNTEKHITHCKHLISIEIIVIFETYFYKCVFISNHNWSKILIVNEKKYNKTVIWCNIIITVTNILIQISISFEKK